jgi:hypothetical protein
VPVGITPNEERQNMQNSRTLHFETYEEAAEWFDTHDMADYEDQLSPGGHWLMNF